MLKELMEGAELKLYQLGLNPYFNGTCSKSYTYETFIHTLYAVLILILMEHAQRGLKLRKPTTFYHLVLILILMEHAQREHFL